MSARKWDREKPAEGGNVRCIPSRSTQGLSLGGGVQQSFAGASGKGPCNPPPLGCLSAFCQCLNTGDRNPGILSLAGLIFFY